MKECLDRTLTTNLEDGQDRLDELSDCWSLSSAVVRWKPLSAFAFSVTDKQP